jgi:hypothetical protein
MLDKIKYLKYKRKIEQFGGGVLDLNNIDIIVDNSEIDFVVSSANLKNETYFQVIKNNKRYLLEKKNINCIYDVPNNKIFIFNDKDELITNDQDINKIKNIIRDNNNVNNFIAFKKKLKEYDIGFIKLFDSEGCYNANLKCIKERLHELNQILQIKYHDLHLEIDDYYNMGGINQINHNNEDYILCLYLDKKCISMIKLRYIGDNMIEISSITEKEYEGKKYNKLLRIISVIIASKLVCNGTQIIALKSEAINPISAWLLISNFNVEYNVDPKDLWDAIYDKDTNLKEAIFKAYGEGEKTGETMSFEIILNLTPENIRKANELFLELTATY